MAEGDERFAKGFVEPPLKAGFLDYDDEACVCGCVWAGITSGCTFSSETSGYEEKACFSGAFFLSASSV